ncbi:Poly-beta-1,6-N-acetyl-D-glucosamine N-deacetylase [Lentilactobacillus hilgardii]|uniref:polysaccharide deacetylase family protein n=1 Tax=Lentilactobacillus hilgardii TaxID=1588 RepID=UPI00019C49E7|nr:polysaccharide deacetylase family protein [Lentilactobacillus hilgardii]EEI20299.1 polysaccharide deacetylase [Lentilactobacillus buchneri ATCC 11577]MCT3396949.1 polysaccharide deacetylase [Lentilactobacillus hilgardii]QIR08675.1 Poly-beta-1,6-N-acetyl-D-glucosamine N-deacetylase [Lentilactobacillus hilgardii]
MNKKARVCILISIIATFLIFLAVSVNRNIRYEIGNHPSYAIPKQDEHIENGVMVFSYHRILNDQSIVKFDEMVSPNSQFHDFNVNLPAFKRQMNALQKNHIKVISLPDLIKMFAIHKKIRGKYVVLTFDDIDRTMIDNALPVLLKHQYPFTDSIITGNTAWYKAGTKLATWPAILKMKKQAGKLVTFGVHTNRMHYLVDKGIPVFNIPSNFMRFKRDYAVSQNVLRRKVGYKSSIFTYPYGSGTPQIQRFLSSRPGLKVILTLNNGIVTDHSDLKQTPRVLINSNSWPSVERWIDE